jgi:hypothetical protein
MTKIKKNKTYMEEKCLDYNFLLNDMGCEESVEASMSI